MPDPSHTLLLMAERHCGQRISSDMAIPIAKGASGRTIIRIKLPGRQDTIIGVHWTSEREDNDSFVPVARILNKSGLRVPAIISYIPESPGAGAALTTDLGDHDLLSFSHHEWEARKPLYESALEQLHKLHHTPIPPYLHLQPPFDADLYRWEQEYFAEHFIQPRFKKQARDFLENPLLENLAERLALLERFPLHRDFQSQNIHIIDNRAWIIDFQGMRMGLTEYDLASLIYDPYARLSAGERESLVHSWEVIDGKPLNREIFRECAIQRIMQATGAFAKLAAQGKIWYKQHLPTAITLLQELTEGTRFQDLFEPLLIEDSNFPPPSC